MNIKTMLLRLQTALNRDGLVDELILSQGNNATEAAKTASTLNFVVGYNSSPSSHAALDLTLWIAHQTRLATRQQVVVQVVYVLEDVHWNPLSHNCQSTACSFPILPGVGPASGQGWQGDPSQLEASARPAAGCALLPNHGESAEPFNYADQVLWQARCLANEWRGSLETHLRFGSVAAELRAVIEAEAATLLILGCKSRKHSLLQQLGQPFPCPILGIPTCAVD